MKKIDKVILSFLNKEGVKAETNIALILMMSNEDKIKMLKFLVVLYYKYGIIPSDNRVRSEIKEIIGKDI